MLDPQQQSSHPPIGLLSCLIQQGPSDVVILSNTILAKLERLVALA